VALYDTDGNSAAPKNWAGDIGFLTSSGKFNIDASISFILLAAINHPRLITT
jgi:hypothetical protein